MTASTTNEGSLAGKVAIVTGAGAGIGKAIAIRLAKAGAKVIVADINPVAGLQAATEIEKTGGTAQFVETDVSSSVSIEALIQHTVSLHGHFHIAVNNAGVPPDVLTIADLDEDSWQRVISVNLTGVALCLKWEVRHLLKQGQGGSIINMASALALRPQERMAAYTAAKHGILGLTRVAALENGRFGIRVNAVAPGGVMTELTKETLETFGETETESAAKTSVLGRFAQPDEVAEAVLWLASGSSAYMTGSTLSVDGGFCLV